MKKKALTYWICQISGWVFYGLTLLFFGYVFNQPPGTNFQPPGAWYYKRMALSLLLGLIFTHILRQLIITFKLRPPTSKNKWWILVLCFTIICIGYSFANSLVVEWFHLYSNPNRKFSIGKRSLYNLINDTPIILVWTTIYYLWHYVQANTKAEIDKIRLESLVKDLELKTIKSHINPHFIFNALNSIRALVDENPTRARTAITELSNILRSSMQAEKVEMAPMERELNIVKDYLALEHIRFEDRLKVEYDIDEDTLEYTVPPMMLQTLVENAIKHGISKEVLGGFIKIKSAFTDDHLELTVQNSGHLNHPEDPNGFGLSSTKNRLKLLYGKKAGFELKEYPDAYMVEAKVIIPV
jgi:two-component sensor histidine kinase